MLKVFTKEELISKLKVIKAMGWIENYRKGNDGSAGNVLEDLLDIPENNLAIANSGEWEFKTKRKTSSSLSTLLHNEPSPRNAFLVPRLLLPYYGWNHQLAGSKYPDTEMSFRQTIYCKRFSDRGFTVQLDRKEEKIVINFDASKVDNRHSDWLNSVAERVGLGSLSPEPYWGFRDVAAHVGAKLVNCFYMFVDVKQENGKEYLQYNDIKMLSTFSMAKFIDALENNYIYIDFDARTGHNHGTKFRIREANIHLLYERVTKI
ncbi:MAG: MvaI/BcnI family restriction endonuclease [Candidatus Cloacimonetes bacterium]|nr:MvaI/BcnI family restriction endonuclease [Candidatus Cloacimonadota bacterium]